MKYEYFALTITDYNKKRLAPHCLLCTHINGEFNYHELNIEEARRIMWELVKKGGTRTFYPNWYDNSISYCEVKLWKRL